jgi:hypothetical protein
MQKYIVTFGFEDPDNGEYQIAKSKPILAESEDAACILLKDQFENMEGMPCDVRSVKLINN